MTDKGKKARVEEDDGSEQLDAELIVAMQKLQEVQDELEKVNEEANDKVLEVEQKYNEIRRPVYQKRSEIIQAIPDFWLTAFLSHPALCDILTEDDQKVFKYLQALDVEDFDVKSGYSISFIFRPNPYFEDTKLTKVFRFTDEGTTSISGTQPRWKDGMDLTNGVTTEKEGNKRTHSDPSFFGWFTSDTQKDVSDGIHHDEVAEVIKEDLWPNPLKYFNNDPDDEDDDDDDDDDEDEYGEDDDDDEDDDNDQGNGADALDGDEEPSDEDDE